MNTTEITELAQQPGDIEAMSMQFKEVEQSEPIPQAVVRKPSARTRYALLTVIVLLLAWLGYTINSSINQINSELEAARAGIARPFK